MKKILIASLVLTIFSASIILFQLSSCKKADAQTNCPTATYPVSGVWIGTYTTTQVAHAPTYASFIIYPDGVFMKRNKVVGNGTDAITRGRWTLTGNNFQYRDTTLLYTGGTVIETGTATFNNDGTMTNATWTNIGSPNYTGAFQNMSRVN